MKTKLRFLILLLGLLTFGLIGCDATEPSQKLTMGVISYETSESIIHWEKVSDAVAYNLTITGEGIETINELIGETSFRTVLNRFEYKFINGVEGAQFTVKLIAVGDGKNYASSNPTYKVFVYSKPIDTDYSSNPYYADLGLGSAADSEVKEILNKKLNDYTKVSYGDARYAIVKSDLSVNDSTKTYGIYNGQLFDNVWDGNKINREHVWPCARLGTGRPDNNTKAISSDLHNLRVIQPGINSTRSDKYFIQGPKSTAEKVGADAFYPGDEHAGDVARICFYMATMYLNLTLVNEKDLPNAAAYTQANAFMGDLESMLRWHLEDPVDEFEIYRNEILFGYQKNRNPYVDFPDLAERVFGASSSQLNDQSINRVDFIPVSIILINAVYVNVSKSEYFNY